MNLKQLYRNISDGSLVLNDIKQYTLCAYSHIQNIPLLEWKVTHNNNSILLAIQVFVNDEIYEPNEIIIQDANYFIIKFDVETTGRANFIFYKKTNDGCGIIDVVSAITPTPSPTLTITPTPS